MFGRRRGKVDPELQWVADLLPFHGLDNAKLALVAKLGRRTTRRTGDVLTEQGSWPDEVHIVVSGRVQVLHNGTLINRVGPGEWIGEISVAKDRARTADAIIHGRTELLTFAKRDFLYLLEHVEGLREQVDHLSAARLERLPSDDAPRPSSDAPASARLAASLEGEDLT